MTIELSTEARELELYFENEEWLIKPSTVSLGRHHKGGNFDYEVALNYLEHRCRDAAKQYIREHGSMTDTWHKVFSVADRKACAESILEGMLAEFRLGNYWD